MSLILTDKSDNKSRTVPAMGNRRIDDIYIHATL